MRTMLEGGGVGGYINPTSFYRLVSCSLAPNPSCSFVDLLFVLRAKLEMS